MTVAIRLYEATEALDICRDLLIEAGGELTPEIEQLLAEAQDTFGQKAERVALFIQELLATAAAVKQERERWKSGAELPPGVSVEQGKHVRIS